MNFFTPIIKMKSDKELQDELRALCDKMIALQIYSYDDIERYEYLLKQIYSRDLEPITKLVPKKL